MKNRNQLKIALSSLSVMLLWGCTSTPKLPWEGKEPQFCRAANCTEYDVVAAFTAASNFCRELHNRYEAGTTYAGYTKATIGVVGTLAGAVAAPLSKGTATKAWAGLAGATNAMQTSMEDAMSTTLALNRQSAISQAMLGYVDTIHADTGTSPLDRVLASVKMSNACWLAVGNADSAALQALASSSKARTAAVSAVPPASAASR